MLTRGRSCAGCGGWFWVLVNVHSKFNIHTEKRGKWYLRSSADSCKVSVPVPTPPPIRIQKVMGWIPGQGTCLGCGSGPQCGCEGQQTHRSFSHQQFSPSLSLPLPSPLSKINKPILRRGLKKKNRVKGQACSGRGDAPERRHSSGVLEGE